ncbi:hypothetical protein [Lysobacter sp. HA35]
MAAPILAYEIRYRIAGSGAQWTTRQFPADSTTISIPGLSRTVSYEGEARSLGPGSLASGWVGVSFTVAGATLAPRAPTGLTATSVADGVALAWSVDADQRSDVEYSVERATSSGGAYAEIARARLTQWTDPTASATVFWYRVRALTFAGTPSAYSNVASAGGVASSAILQALTDIASDNVLTPVEKSTVIADYTALTAEQSGIDAQATTYGLTAAKATYDASITALAAYLATLTAPVAWNNTGGNTTIVGTTFRTKFTDVYAARQALLNAIAAKAKQLADTASGRAGGGKFALPNGNFASNMGGTPVGTTVTATGASVSDGWAILGADPAWAAVYEQPAGANADVLVRLAAGVSIAASTSQSLYLTSAPQVSAPPAGTPYTLTVTRVAANNVALSAGFAVVARFYIQFMDAAGGSVAVQSVTDISGTSYAATTTLAAGTVPANAASYRVVLQAVVANGTASAATAAASGLPADIRWSNVGLVFATDLASEVSGHLLDNRRLPQIMVGNGRAKVPTTITYAASAGTPAVGTINVGAFTVLGGDYTLSYSASSVGVSGTGGSTVQYYLYMDDPNHVGGARTLVATTNGNDIYGSSGRIYIGDCAVTFPTSGSAGGPGGRDDRCVTEAMWLDAATSAGAALDGMEFDVIDLPNTGTEPRRAAVRVLGRGIKPCVLLDTGDGFELDCSTTAPFDLRDGGSAFAPDMLGREVWTDGGWRTVLAVRDIGLQPVVYLSFGGLSFAAGRDPARRIYSHNLQQKP